MESETAGEVGLVAKVPFMVAWGFGAGKSLLQQFPGNMGFWLGGELIIGLMRDREDSVSVCSKKTYFTARSRARPRVITCSRSILVGGEQRQSHASVSYCTGINSRQMYSWNEESSLFNAFTW